MNQNNTALLVIDPVNSCAHLNCETPEWHIHFTQIREMIPRLEQFLAAYRQKVGGLIVFTTITPWDQAHLPANLNELYTDPAATYYSDDPTGFDQQFYGVKPQPTDLVFTKNTYDAFSDLQITHEFRKRGIQYVIVTGIFTDGCVLASIVSGFSQGFNFVILADLVETTDVPVRQQLQELLLKFTFPVMYGKTISSTELLQEPSLLRSP